MSLEPIISAFALVRDKTDREILGSLLQEKDREAEYLNGRQYYFWYHLIAAFLQPKAIGEIGVRFGYSLKAMASACQKKPGIWGFDSEVEEPGCLEIAREGLTPWSHYLSLVKADTLKLDSLPMAPVDLFQVDGDHSTPATLHNLHLAWEVLSPGGVLLIDDIRYNNAVVLAADQFYAEHGLKPLFIPTFTGMHALEKL